MWINVCELAWSWCATTTSGTVRIRYYRIHLSSSTCDGRQIRATAKWKRFSFWENIYSRRLRIFWNFQILRVLFGSSWFLLLLLFIFFAEIFAFSIFVQWITITSSRLISVIIINWKIHISNRKHTCCFYTIYTLVIRPKTCLDGRYTGLAKRHRYRIYDESPLRIKNRYSVTHRFRLWSFYFTKSLITVPLVKTRHSNPHFSAEELKSLWFRT